MNRIQIRPRGWMFTAAIVAAVSVTARKRVQHEFNPVRHTKLVVDPQRALLDHVLLNRELLGDLAVADPFRNQADHLIVARDVPIPVITAGSPQWKLLGNEPSGT